MATTHTRASGSTSRTIAWMGLGTPRCSVRPWAFLIVLDLFAPVVRADPPAVPIEPPGLPAPVIAILEEFCLGCHSSGEPSGGIDLSLAKNGHDIYAQGRTWTKAQRVLRDRTMPPKNDPQPNDVQRQQLADWIESSMRSVDCRSQDEPGRVTIRRLNRVEYRHTMRDLLGITIDAGKDLPSDAAGNGFDNQGDTLFIPPVLMEKYLDATRKSLGEAFASEQSRSKILPVPLPSDTKDAASLETALRENLSSFMRKAFRRPIESTEVDSRARLALDEVERGSSIEDGIRVAFTSILLSPYFLFRVEQNHEGDDKAYRISDYELAVRLSYFLWSTTPDDELRDFADQGILHRPDVLRSQVQRMLADDRARALTDNYAAQLYGFRDLRTHEMDIRRYGAFGGVRDALYDEIHTFFDQLLRGNGRLLDILDCDYVYVNENLARHYGIPDVKGGEIRKIKAPDRRRGGVLGMGSTLVVTSYPTRHSPILRGKWVLETILGTPPPPPPPNVGAVSQDDTLRDGMTLRQRLEAHRRNAACASCHARMDPIGFGLENYDAIGQWRDTENDLPVDNKAQLPDGTEFQGPEGLKDVLLAKKDLFLRHLIETMLTYALGRAVDYYDECTVREAFDRLARNDYHSHELIHAIVESYPFQHRRNSN